MEGGPYISLIVCLVIIMRYRILFSACLLLLVASCSEPPKKEATAQETGAAETEAQLVARALAIHDRVSDAGHSRGYAAAHD